MKLKIEWLGKIQDVQTRFGLKQKSSIKVSNEPYADKFLSYWLSPQTKEWAVGKEIEVESVDERDYQGKKYYDIKMSKGQFGGMAELSKKVEGMEFKLVKMNLLLEELVEAKRKDEKIKITGTDIDYPDEGIESDQIPF